MIKSMTGYSKIDINEGTLSATVELKSLNGRYLEFNCRIPKSISHKEIEIRDILKDTISRGTVTVTINIGADGTNQPFLINEDSVQEYYNKLLSLKRKLKLKEDVKLEHLLHFSNNFQMKEDDTTTEKYWKIIKKALFQAAASLEKTRNNEGKNIAKDIQNRMKNIKQLVGEIEVLGVSRVPLEREKLRQRIAQLFESDEIDEQRLQMEIVLMADKLDISEECVRLNSHFKFFNDMMKEKGQSGQKLNFLLQEMNREINTIGSKADDAKISQIVINVKEELERIREQAQNIE